MKSIMLCVWFCLALTGSWAQGNKTVQEKSVKVGQEKDTWQKLSTAEFGKLLSDTTILLIDVRTPDEYKSGHISGAKNIDVKNWSFDQEIGKLDSCRPVAVYCRSGMRSTMAAVKLTQKGFKVFELEKGINSWTGEKEK